MIYACEQNTPEWDGLRRGRITASRIVDVMAYNQPSAVQAKAAGYGGTAPVRDAVAAGMKGAEAGARASYRMELLAERLTGQSPENGASFAKRVQWGIEHEPYAAGAYMVRYGVSTKRVGFITHPEMDFAGGSPDRLAGDDGVLEIKCPESITHLQWMKDGVVPEDHREQCTFNTDCAERDWCDFVSYDPRMPEALRLFVARQYRDEKRIAEVRNEVVKFEAEIQAQLQQLLTGNTNV